VTEFPVRGIFFSMKLWLWKLTHLASLLDLDASIHCHSSLHVELLQDQLPEFPPPPPPIRLGVVPDWVADICSALSDHVDMELEFPSLEFEQNKSKSSIPHSAGDSSNTLYGHCA
jgi:hypothetical protein